MPLVVWPGFAHAFSTPKTLAMILGAGAVLATRLSSRAAPVPGRTPLVLPFAWVASFLVSTLVNGAASPESLTLAIAGALWYWALTRCEGTRLVVAAHAAAVTLVAGIAIAQRLGADPLALAGWTPVIMPGASLRLSVYGTLGNPNFVAALVAPTVFLTLGLAATARGRARRSWTAAVIIQLGALIATGSRGGALGLAAGLAASLVVTTSARGRTHRAGALLVAAGIALVMTTSPGRAVADAMAGRLYIWRIAFAHAASAPLVGHGPGAFELAYPGWEAADRPPSIPERDGVATSISRGGRLLDGQRQFRGPQQHAHNDYLEALLDRGLLGLVTILLLLATPVYRAVRRREDPGGTLDAAVAHAALALAAVALVDFPLARPAEVALAWMLAAVAGHASAGNRESSLELEDGMPSVRRWSFMVAALAAAMVVGAAAPRLMASTEAFEQRRMALQRQLADAQRAEGLAGNANRKALYTKYPTPEIGLAKIVSAAPGQTFSATVPGTFLEGTVFLVENAHVTVTDEAPTASGYAATVTVSGNAPPSFVRVWAFSPVSGAWNRTSVAFIGQAREYRYSASNGWTIVLTPRGKAFAVTQNEAELPYAVEFFKSGEAAAFETLSMVMKFEPGRTSQSVSASLERDSSGAMAEYERLTRDMSDGEKFMKMTPKQQEALMNKMTKLMEQVQLDLQTSMATEQAWRQEFGCHYLSVSLEPGGTGNVSCGDTVGNLQLTQRGQ